MVLHDRPTTGKRVDRVDVINFTRASEAPVVSLTVVFCLSQLSFWKIYFAEPSTRLVPDLVTMLTIAP